MVTSKPEVKRFELESGYDSMMRRVNRMKESEDGVYVRFDDYEALQAECDALKSELAESRANDRQAMAYLEAVREIVGGSSFPEMIERVKELQIERNEYKLALKEWLEKSEWVQETASDKELGKHRADVMRERIQELLEERDQLLAAIRRLCNIYVVDGYYEGEMREKLLDDAVNRAIERGKGKQG